MKDKMNELPEEENTGSTLSEMEVEGPEESSFSRNSRKGHSKAQLLDELEEMDGKVEELSVRVSKLEAEKEEMKESSARSRADLYNFRQRIERERSREKKLARESSVLDILPVLDNLDRALSFPEGTDLVSVLDGVVMVQRQFANVLNSMGVNEIPTRGEKFSPEFHEAVAIQEVDDPAQDGIIMEEFMKGYILSDKVIRPARVQVAKYVKVAEKEE